MLLSFRHQERPRVLVIDDSEADRESAAMVLEEAGFEVELTSNLLEGEDAAMALLRLGETTPVLLVLDLVFTMHGPGIEGWHLALALLGRMARGEIRRAPIVALSNALTVERGDSAGYAGCISVLTKPLHFHMVAHLRKIVAAPITLPEERPLQSEEIARARRVTQYWAEQALADLRARSAREPLVWTALDATLVLCALTPYRGPKHINQRRQAMLLAALGDRDGARSVLRSCAMHAGEPFQTLIYGLLAGQTESALAKRDIRRDDGTIMHQSTVYRCLGKLPEVVAPAFRRVAPTLPLLNQPLAQGDVTEPLNR